MEDVFVLVGDRQHEHARQRGHGRDLLDRLDPRHSRHVQVHHDHVRRDLAHQPDGVGSVIGFAGDLHAALLEEVAQAGAEQVVVVDEQNADARRFGFLGGLSGLAHRPPFVLAGRSLTP